MARPTVRVGLAGPGGSRSTEHDEGLTIMTREAPARESLLELYDALAQHQLRDAGAEVAAAIAHAVGTPLNVISGRAELIRHDPANALAQVTRIEEQVKKLANGLRQLVDYLAVPDPRAAQRPGAAIKRAAEAARETDAIPAGSAARDVSAQDVAAQDAAATEAPIVEAKAVVEDVLALSDALARASGVEVAAETGALNGARVERWHALGTLSSLVSGAIRHAEAKGRSAAGGSAGIAKVRLVATVASQGVVFELSVPGLPLIEGWQLEHFQARPATSDVPELYRTLSICAAVVRGHGGRLVIEAAAGAEAAVIRFSCRNEAS
jgi:signal transduction histidine kinase